MDSSGTAMRWPMAGRERELAAFDAAWSDRLCQAVVFFGPSGVGKSRLAEECTARAERTGFRSARARTGATAAMMPLGALGHLLPPDADLSDPTEGFAGVARLLGGPSESRWVLLVDDVQVLDATSAVLLRQLMDARVVRVIGAVRTGGAVSPAVNLLCSGDAVRRIDLGLFEQKQSRAVLRGALGRPVGRRSLHRLHTASGGSPLYLRELVLGALQSGQLACDGEVWELAADRPTATPRLAELIGGRLAEAPPATCPVLEMLALAEPLALADAEAVAPLDELAALEEAGLVRVTVERRRTLIPLAHPLYGEAVRESIPAGRRRDLLLQRARSLETRGARRQGDLLDLAGWRLAATGTADPSLLLQAAGLARHAHDYAQAVALLRAVPEPERSLACHLLLGESLFELGDFEPADRSFELAGLLAETEEQMVAVVMERTQSLFWGAGRTDEALAVNESGLAKVSDPAMRQILTINEDCMRICVGDPHRGLDLLGGIDDVADPRARLYGLAVKSAALQATGRTEEAVRLSERTYDQHLRSGGTAIVQTAAWQLFYTAIAQCSAGLLDRVGRTADRAYAGIVNEHAPLPQVWAALALGQHSWLAGHPADARRWFAEALSRGRRHRLPLVLRLAASRLTASCAVLGDESAAEAALAEAESHPRHTVYWEGQELPGEAWALAGRGRLAEAVEVLHRAAAAARERGHLVSEAVLLTDIARFGRAADVQDRLAELAELCDGGFAPARARLAAALAADDAVRLMSAAAELEGLGADLLAAEAFTTASTAWQRSGGSRQAVGAARSAAACAKRCQGAQTPLLATADTVVALTERETEVARLAAAGVTSKGIADQLCLSSRTVENHLQRIYAKLGVTSRLSLAEALQATEG